MIKNKKSLAGTSERNLTPKLYPKPKGYSNTLELVLICILILLLSGLVTFYILLKFQLI